jgi:hypothetical protein
LVCLACLFVCLCVPFEIVEQPLVLLCVSLQMLNNHLFYCVFVQKRLKINAFITFSFHTVAFLVNILVRKCEAHKKVKQPLVFIWKLVKKEQVFI